MNSQTPSASCSVTHRIGGLEILNIAEIIVLTVIHRIGGLENHLRLTFRSSLVVIHRIGGLEKQQQNSQVRRRRYTPHRWLRNQDFCKIQPADTLHTA